MWVSINGKLAVEVISSPILGLKARDSAEMFVRAYQKLFPYAIIKIETNDIQVCNREKEKMVKE